MTHSFYPALATVLCFSFWSFPCVAGTEDIVPMRGISWGMELTEFQSRLDEEKKEDITAAQAKLLETLKLDETTGKKASANVGYKFTEGELNAVALTISAVPDEDLPRVMDYFQTLFDEEYSERLVNGVPCLTRKNCVSSVWKKDKDTVVFLESEENNPQRITVMFAAKDFWDAHDEHLSPHPVLKGKDVEFCKAMNNFLRDNKQGNFTSSVTFSLEKSDRHDELWTTLSYFDQPENENIPAEDSIALVAHMAKVFRSMSINPDTLQLSCRAYSVEKSIDKKNQRLFYGSAFLYPGDNSPVWETWSSGDKELASK